MPQNDKYDVIIIGVGPAGISAAARAQANNIKYLALEKGALANTLDYYYQLGKYVMALPGPIPLRSDVGFQAGSREDILHVWNDYAQEAQLHVKLNEAVETVTKTGETFEVKTGQDVYHAAHVILAIGRMGNPRRLNVPGDNLEHVADRLVDPKAYTNRDILVVGAGDAAAEVALALAEQNRVSLSCRSAEFDRMNDSLRGQVLEKAESGAITVYYKADVERVEPGFVTLNLPDRDVRVKADYVFVKIGAEVPRQFLERCGVTFPSADVTALPIINPQRYESEVPGLYLIGSIGGRDLIKHSMNEGYEVIEHILGHALEPVDEALLRESLQLIPGTSVDEKLDYIRARVPFLADVPKQQLREPAQLSTVHQVEAGASIFAEDDPTTTLFTIVDGSVELSFRADPSRRIVLRQGEFFGEMGLFADRRRTATVQAAEPSILIELPRRTVLKLLKLEPSVKRFFDRTSVLRALQTYLYPDLDAGAFRPLSEKAELVSYKKGEVIFHEGDEGDAFYVIRSGTIKISKKGRDGREYVLTYRPAGDFFGEMALLGDENRRGATITAAIKTEVIRIRRDDFLAFLAAHPELQARIQQEIFQRNVANSAVLAEPTKKTLVNDFLKYGGVESTDILLIEETKCIHCDNCVTACAVTHNGQTRLDRKRGPSFGHIHVPISCRHCEGAPCLQDCPPGDAIVRDANGVVTIYEDKCIGCGNCASYCPYGVIFMVDAPEHHSFWEHFNLFNLLRKERKAAVGGGGHRTLAVKCDLCQNDPKGPACVRSCPTGAAIRVSPAYFTQVEYRGGDGA